MRERGRSPRPGPPAWLIPLLLAAWTLAAFQGILSHQFVDWDDSTYVYENPNVQGLTPAHLGWMVTAFHMGHYHPLTWLSLAVDHEVWGLNPRGFLLTNLALHIASGVLLYILWRQIRPLVADETSASAWLGGLAVAIFLVHPLRVEAVAWISDRKELLASVFCLSSLIAYVRARTVAESGNRWVLASGILFVLSLLSKATAVGLPVVLVALDVLLFKRLAQAPERPAVAPWRLLAEKWLHLAGMGVMLVLAPLAQGRFGAAAPLELYPLSSRLAQAGYNLCYHPWKTLWPSGLCCLYPLRVPFDPLAPRFVVSAILVLAALVAVGWMAWRPKSSRSDEWVRNFWPAFFLGTYLVFVLPVSGLWQSGAQFVADRYSYFPAMLLALAATAIPTRWIARALATPERRWTLAGCTTALLAVLLLTTAQQADTWQNSQTLWNRALACDPLNVSAWNNLAQFHRDRREVAQARACYERAVELDPQPTFLISLGSLEAAAGNTTKARELYRRAIAKNATFHEAHYNLANLLVRDGATGEALPHYAEAWRLAPGEFALGANYARALLVAGRWGESAEVYRAAIALAPDRSLGWEGLGGALLSAGETAAAVEALVKAGQSADATPHGALLLAKGHEQMGNAAQRARCWPKRPRRWPAQTAPHREMAARLEQRDRR